MEIEGKLEETLLATSTAQEERGSIEQQLCFVYNSVFHTLYSL
jgi:hypothetical protein